MIQLFLPKIQDYRSFSCEFPKCLELLRNVGTSGACCSCVIQERAGMKPSVMLVLFGATTYNVLVAMLQFSAVES